MKASLIDYDKEFEIPKGKNIIGRLNDKSNADIKLGPGFTYLCISAYHCKIYNEKELEVEDLDSTNGTFINGVQIYPGKRYKLNNKDILRLGQLNLEIKVNQGLRNLFGLL